MEKIKDLSTLPPIEDLRRICRGIAALEIVMCQQKQYRYYFYDPNWGEQEEVFRLINGCGSVWSGCNSHMIILFSPYGCVINGFDNCSYDSEVQINMDEDGSIDFCILSDKARKNARKMKQLKQGMPSAFNKLMYGKTVKRMGTTFCMWRTKDGEWSRAHIAGTRKDGSAEMLEILNPSAEKYVEFCGWYYQVSVPLDIAQKVYDGEPLTIEMITGLNNKIENLELIREELDQMKYPHTLKYTHDR